VTKKRKRAPKKDVSDKLRASDEKLREELRNADLGKFDRALVKAIKQPTAQ
jgi:hypothetical protein